MDDDDVLVLEPPLRSRLLFPGNRYVLCGHNRRSKGCAGSENMGTFQIEAPSKYEIPHCPGRGVVVLGRRPDQRRERRRRKRGHGVSRPWLHSLQVSLSCAIFNKLRGVLLCARQFLPG